MIALKQRLLKDIRSGMWALLALSALGPARAGATDFRVTAPKSWAKTETWTATGRGEFTIYRARDSAANEMVVTESFPAEFRDPEFQAHLNDHRAQIEKARAAFFAQSGLAGFSILAVQRKATRLRGFAAVDVLQSRFRDLEGREVQMLERQYVARGKMFVVSYLVDAPALNGRDKADAILDTFAPLAPPPGREPASVAAAEVVMSGAGTVGEITEPAAEADSPRHLNMSDPENQKRCESVPVEKRRQVGEADFTHLVTENLAAGRGCVKGLVDSAIGFVKGIYDAGEFAARYAWSWVAGTDYRHQVHAVVGSVAAEMKKDWKNFGRRVLTAGYDAGVKFVGDFFQCLNVEAQAHAVCTALTVLNPRILVLMLTKAPIAAREAALVADAFRAALKAPAGPESRLVEKAATEAAAVRVAEDGPRTHEFDNGFSVKITDAPPPTAAQPAGPSELAGSLRRALGHPALRADDRVGADAIRAVAFERRSLAELESQLQRTPGISPPDRALLLQRLRDAVTKTEDLRSRYSEFLIVPREAEAKMLSAIATLEERGVPRERIRAELKKTEKLCPRR